MVRFSLASLRARLSAVILLALLPSLAFALLSYVEDRRLEMQEAEAELGRLARLAAESEAAVVEGARQLLTALATLPQVQDADPDGCSRLLAGLLKQHPQYAHLGAVAPDGHLFCSALPFNDDVNLSDRSWFQRALQGHRFSLGHDPMEMGTGQPMLGFASPVLSDTGEVQVVVFAAMDLARLGRIALATERPAGAILVIVDRSGTILLRRPDSDTAGLPQSALVEAMLVDGEGILEVAGAPEDVPYVYAFAPVGEAEESGLVLGLGIPKAQAVADADRALASRLIGLGLAGAAALALTWMGAEQFVLRQANSLLGVMRRLADGESGARVGASGDVGDLTRLAQSFDQIAASLERREAEGREVEARLQREAGRSRVLAEVSRELEAAGAELPAILEAVARRAAEAFGDACVVRLLGQEGTFWDQVVGYHPNSAVLSRMHPWLAEAGPGADDAPEREMARAPRPVPVTAVLDADTADRVGPEYRARLGRLGVHAFLIVPLCNQGRAIGTLSLYRLSPDRPYSTGDQALLGDFADRAALAVAGARLHIDQRKQLETLAALHAGSQELPGILDPDELAETVVRTCVKVFGATLAWLGRTEPDGRLSARAVFPKAGEGGNGSPRIGDAALDALIGRAIRSGVPEVGSLQASDSHAGTWPEGALGERRRACAVLPLIHRDRPLGAMVVYSDSPDFFNTERVDLLRAYTLQAAVALEMARLYAEGARLLNHVQALDTVDLAIAASLELPVVLHVLLDQVTSQLGVDAASVLLFNRRTRQLEYAAQRGFRTTALRHTRLELGEGHAGRAARAGELVFIRNLSDEPGDLSRAPLLRSEGFACYYAVPLASKGQIMGVLEVFHRSPLNPDSAWLAFLKTLSGRAAIAIENATLFDELQRSNTELTLSYEATLEGWARALELRDRETEGHTERVTELTMKLARAMGVGGAEEIHLRRGALLHDIGKMGVPDSILLKPGPLTGEEWVVMRRHPVYAHDMLSPIPYLRHALDIPHCHHERWDGTGYPQGLRGEAIPLAARIFAVVDVWDALLSDRPYRQAWPRGRVLHHIRALSGTHFDPAVVEAFMKLMATEGGGTLAELGLAITGDLADLAGG